VIAAALVSACLQGTEPTVPQSLTAESGLWLLHVHGGRFQDRVELVNIWASGDASSPLSLESLPTRLWDGSADGLFDVQDSRGSVDHGIVSWSILIQPGDTVTMAYPAAGDTVSGTWTERAAGVDSTPLSFVGIRIPTVTILPSTASEPMAARDSTPIVVVRIDDNQPTDPDFETRLRTRGLYGEIAVPTAYVGKGGRPDWSALHTLVDEGFVPVAHSRVHGDAPRADEDFMGEVVGSLADLALHNMPTAIFVQPGTWHDSLDFDAPATLENWRGSLLRTFTANVEAYVYPVPRAWPMTDSIRMGLGHYTLSDGATAQSILYAWQLARLPWHGTVFLVHTLNLTSPSELDWFLDTLAAAKRSGRIRLAHSTIAFFSPSP